MFDEGLPSVSSFLRPRQALGIRLARHARTCNSGVQGQFLLSLLILLHLGLRLRFYFSFLKSKLEKERPRVLSRRHRGIWSNSPEDLFDTGNVFRIGGYLSKVSLITSLCGLQSLFSCNIKLLTICSIVMTLSVHRLLLPRPYIEIQDGRIYYSGIDPQRYMSRTEGL
jgi:hypothetical protein